AHRVAMGAGEQEYLFDPLHRSHERVAVGQVGLRRLNVLGKAAALFLVANDGPHRFTFGQKRLDQTRADLAASTNHKNQRGALLSAAGRKGTHAIPALSRSTPSHGSQVDPADARARRTRPPRSVIDTPR